MAVCPELSDSEDSAMSDDCDYYDFKEKVRNMNKAKLQSLICSEEDKSRLQLRSLFNALSSGNVQAVSEYFDHGVDIDANVQDGWTPLLLAASFGNPDLVKELIKRGANIHLDRDGCTALMMAANCPKPTSPFEKSFDVVKQLVENGADVKVVNRKRITALMFAANNGNLRAVRYLLPLSNKNAEDNQRWTALFWAVNNNQSSVAKYLLEEGFEYTIPDIRNNTPVDIARNNDFLEIIDMFPKEDADIISNIIDSHSCSFEDIFTGLKHGEKPKFFLDICNILCGVKAEAMIKILSEKNVGLYDFMSTSEKELKELGIYLPYQRNRILGGIYRFHKYPFHPKSLHAVPLKEVYSNTDMAIQILTTIKQVIVMEASLAYILKHYSDQKVSKAEMPLMVKTIENIQKKISTSKITLRKLREKTEMLDHQIKPVDLITSKSRTYFLPWRKIMFSFSVISLVFVFKVLK